jgi:hypothetical protein
MTSADEFRRFRVKSEMARKQYESSIRELQSSVAEKVTHRIINGNVDSTGNINNKTESEQIRSLTNQLERIRMEMSNKEANWKHAYEALSAENKALQSSGSEALLASQWRQRYENCLSEKDDLGSRLKQLSPSTTTNTEYEAKYKDLKGSYSLRQSTRDLFFDRCISINVCFLCAHKMC